MYIQFRIWGLGYLTASSFTATRQPGYYREYVCEMRTGGVCHIGAGTSREMRDVSQRADGNLKENKDSSPAGHRQCDFV